MKSIPRACSRERRAKVLCEPNVPKIPYPPERKQIITVNSQREMYCLKDTVSTHTVILYVRNCKTSFKQKLIRYYAGLQIENRSNSIHCILPQLQWPMKMSPASPRKGSPCHPAKVKNYRFSYTLQRSPNDEELCTSRFVEFVDISHLQYASTTEVSNSSGTVS